MTQRAKLFFKYRPLKLRQRGAALILMVFILGLAVVAYTIKSFNVASMRAEQDVKTTLALKQAKQALIAWSVSHPNWPGIMPFPDRLETTSPNYDGKSDCVTFGLNNSHLIGKLPLLGDAPCISPQVGLGVDPLDSSGERLWYAVSKNLIRTSSSDPTPNINPSIMGSQWLRVLDANGNEISNRVAVVIIAPGLPLSGQNRSGTTPPIGAFLDEIVIGGTTYSNRDYDQDDEDFIVGDITTLTLNDKLVYITIDELMYAIEKRVLMEAKTALNSYYVTNGYYPFAAGLGSPTNQNQCTQGNLRGLLPVVTPSLHTCTCTVGDKTCRCNFSVISSVAFTRNADTFVADDGGANAPIGACSVLTSDTAKCTCTGAGSCKNASGAIEYSCDACGECKATVDGTSTFDTSGEFTSAAATGSCSSTPTQSVCSNAADGTFTLAACDANETVKSLPNAGGLLPAWFMANEWEKYIVYAVSNDCVSSATCATATSPPKITVGLNLNVNSIVAASVVNPNNSCNIVNYLGSVENTNVITSNGLQDSLYKKTQPRTQANTDQLVVIP